MGGFSAVIDFPAARIIDEMNIAFFPAARGGLLLPNRFPHRTTTERPATMDERAAG